MQRFKFVCESLTVEKLMVGSSKVEGREYALIKIKNIDTGYSIPSVFSDYILKNYSHLSFSTQRKVANNIIPFLNFVCIENAESYGIESFCDIDFSIGKDFLDSLAMKNIDEKTAKRYEKDLIKFYYFLAESNILTNLKISDFKFIYSNNKSRLSQTIKSPFKYIMNP